VVKEYLEKRKQEGQSFEFVAYIGDGSNDFCPMQKLSSNDIAFCREGEKYGILPRIEKEAKGERKLTLSSELVKWTSAETIRQKLLAKLAINNRE
jgi:pyridoxal phosphate phosphatase PHOSPHO2